MQEEKQKLPDLYLAEGEEIKWTGQPHFSMRTFLQNQRYFVWVVLALISVLSALFAFSRADAARYCITSLIAILIMVFSYTRTSWNNLKKSFLLTRYVITNERLIYYDVQQSSQLSMPLSEIRHIEFVPMKNGYGTIKLSNNWVLLSIPNAGDVKKLLESLMS